MSRYRDNSPVGHTCPDINEAQNISSNAIDAIDSSLSAFNDAKDYLNSLIQQLELLRSENSELREWGNEQHDNAEFFESKVCELESENSDLSNKIEDLLSEIEDLRNELR